MSAYTPFRSCFFGYHLVKDDSHLLKSCPFSKKIIDTNGKQIQCVAAKKNIDFRKRPTVFKICLINWYQYIEMVEGDK